MTPIRHFFSWIPNSITALNLCAGAIAIYFGLQGEIALAAILIAVASVFDFADGLFARLLHSYSEIGKQLDSLADVVSFGLAPAAILLNLMQQSLLPANTGNPAMDASSCPDILVLSVLIIPVAGAFRLAKFNIDTRQNDHFLGLPIPANALFFASLALVIEYGNNPTLHSILLSPLFLIAAMIVFAALMISELPMFSLKFKHLKWEGNQIRFLFIGLCPLLILIFHLNALPLILLTYIFLSVAAKLAGKN